MGFVSVLGCPSGFGSRFRRSKSGLFVFYGIHVGLVCVLGDPGAVGSSLGDPDGICSPFRGSSSVLFLFWEIQVGFVHILGCRARVGSHFRGS